MGQEARILLAAARLLRECGWTRGSYHRRRRGKDYYCVVGAIAETMKMSPDSHVVGYVERYVSRRLRDYIADGSSLTEWNDRQPSKQAVIKALEAAARG